MESFTDQISKEFYEKEWLVQLDNSRPYLFKFLSLDTGCSILVTDTVNVWYEGLDMKQIARRWRRLNSHEGPLESDSEEFDWRRKTVQKIEYIHSLKSVSDSLFSIESSRDADLAFELRISGSRWHWECYSLGPTTSANILSKHLIMPLLSIAHLSFTCADAVSELSTNDLQDAVDKLARTGRRAQDIHIRQTISRPRITTTLARLTALFNFTNTTPPIVSELDQIYQKDPSNNDDMINITAQEIMTPVSSFSNNAIKTAADNPVGSPIAVQRDKESPQVQKKTKENKKSEIPAPLSPFRPSAEESGSATEPDSENEELQPIGGTGKSKIKVSQTPPLAPVPKPTDLDSDSATAPQPRPSKKTKYVKSDSNSSDSEGPINKPASRQGSKPPIQRVGVRQPVKRGGRRF